MADGQSLGLMIHLDEGPGKPRCLAYIDFGGGGSRAAGGSVGSRSAVLAADVEAAVSDPTALRRWGILVFVVAVAVAFRLSRVLSGWQSLHRWLRCLWTAPCSCFPIKTLRLTPVCAAFQSAQGDLLHLGSATPFSEAVQSGGRLVLVSVSGGGKTKMMQCEARSTVGAMREDMGVP
eukprot:CAMPEP_0175878358 /NCGR_PEP_ID=MMETSP0107_2-20121207/41132_1 /TAXON_ID=195067 ORGANISM="Goniomonas pacifica, Strain CCMP1869" /NCGR_SAMPLE_ID=MMETSP0107_2 /ASSEMBLY_ACC=CAM_ASM_000203 /LENGTH=176 /DNA_ID=CAMNT_0017197811 /DNA_START=9 /DNA_END=536 /DNA_ORIENTATION=-